jgi:hypothetical protein
VREKTKREKTGSYEQCPQKGMNSTYQRESEPPGAASKGAIVFEVRKKIALVFVFLNDNTSVERLCSSFGRPRLLPYSYPNCSLQMRCPRCSDDSPPPLPHRAWHPVSSRLPGRLAPAFSTTAPRGLCLLSTPMAAAYASSACRWPQLGPACPHGHQRRRSALAT